jgi:hypothetical protein
VLSISEGLVRYFSRDSPECWGLHRLQRLLRRSAVAGPPLAERAAVAVAALHFQLMQPAQA